MPKKRSSHQKLTRKVSSPTPPTTSSTTASPPPEPAGPATDPGPVEFTAALQDEYLHLLSRGASPAAACLQLNLPVTVVPNHINTNANFRDRLDQIHDVLSQNVAAALYRSAMEGSVSAQTFFLKNCPPPEWPAVGSPGPTPNDGLDDLSDEELQQMLKGVK